MFYWGKQRKTVNSFSTPFSSAVYELSSPHQTVCQYSLLISSANPSKPLFMNSASYPLMSPGATPCCSHAASDGAAHRPAGQFFSSTRLKLVREHSCPKLQPALKVQLVDTGVLVKQHTNCDSSGKVARIQSIFRENLFTLPLVLFCLESFMCSRLSPSCCEALLDYFFFFPAGNECSIKATLV